MAAGRCRDFTLAELKRLNAGKGETIPSLAEVVEEVAGKAHLIVEVKHPEAAPALLRFFQARDIFAQTHVISFWHPVVKALKEQEPRLRTGVLLVGCPADPVGLARAALAEALVLHYGYVTPDLVTGRPCRGPSGLHLEYRRRGDPEALPGHEPGRHRQQLPGRPGGVY